MEIRGSFLDEQPGDATNNRGGPGGRRVTITAVIPAAAAIAASLLPWPQLCGGA